MSSRFFRSIADVRAEEAATALILALDVFLLLCAYYLLKVAREPLILMGGGAEVKSYAAAGQAALLVPVIYAYDALAARLGRMALVASVTVFFVVDLLVFAALVQRGVAIGVPFYLWVGVFNVTVIAQFWSLAADVFSPDQGQRIFPVLGIGSSIGAVAGSAIARSAARLGPQALMLIAAAVLLASLALTYAVGSRTSRHTPTARASQPLGGKSGASMIAGDRYLWLVAALTLLLNWVNSTGEYLLDRTLVAVAPAEAARAGATVGAYVATFKATYFAWVNGLTVTMQLFVVGRVIKHLGIRAALFVVPVFSLGGYALLALAPLLPIALGTKVVENGIDYSLQNTARHALFLLVPRAAKYKAKAVIDTFVVRLGDVLAGVVVALGHVLRFDTAHFALCGAVLTIAWIATLVALAREHARRSADVPAAAPLRSTRRRFASGRVRLAAVAAVALALLTPRVARADDHDGVEWNPAWPRVRSWEVVDAFALTVGDTLFETKVPLPNHASWRGGIGFDDWARTTFRGHSLSTQSAASTLSDMLYIGSSFFPLVVDDYIATLSVHQNADVALQMLVIDMQSLGVSGLISLAAEHGVGRARPYTESCNDRDATGRLLHTCGTGNDNRSFFSGHATATATIAGLTCVHHQHLPLYGGGAADLAPCLLMIGVAATTGVLRLVYDEHWASDVMIGWAVGALSGYVLPSVLHYGFGHGHPLGEIRSAHLTLSPTVEAYPSGAGIGVVGGF